MEDPINVINTPLKEEYYNSQNEDEYLKNEHFHHSDKGCQIEMIRSCQRGKGNQTNWFINKKCLTHDKICEKTGWELGWYLGRNNRGEKDKMCQKCGTPFKSISITARYCIPCRHILQVERMRINNKKVREKRLKEKL